MRHAPVACPTTATLRDAAQKMADEKVRTIIVVDGHGMPAGTSHVVDLLERVVLPGRPLATPVSEAMSTPVVSLPGSSTAYEAMHVMTSAASARWSSSGTGGSWAWSTSAISSPCSA
ncbi:MAG: CBS domain-containing protein [Burkholderiales bacterium]